MVVIWHMKKCNMRAVCAMTESREGCIFKRWADFFVVPMEKTGAKRGRHAEMRLHKNE